MKNTLLTTLILVLCGAGTASGSIISFVPVAGVSVGDIFTVDITADTDSLYAFNFDVTFDPTILNATNVTGLGDFIDNAGYLDIDNSTDPTDPTAGTISFIYSIATSGDADSGPVLPLAELTFTALAPGDATLNFANYAIAQFPGDINGDPNITANSLGITVNPTPEPATCVLLLAAAAALLAHRLLMWNRRRAHI